MIKKKDIEGLNQLDRIEYKLEKKEIDEINSSSLTISLLNLIIYLTLFIVGFSVVLLFVDSTRATPIVMKIMNSLNILFVIAIAAGIIVDTILFYIYNYQKKKLDEKFFNIKIEKKKK